MDNKLVYICSPYRGEVERNLEYARELTRKALDCGFVPVTPHLYLTQVVNEDDPAERDTGMAAGRSLLAQCSYILIGSKYGLSEGMLGEIDLALELGLKELAPEAGGLEVVYAQERTLPEVKAAFISAMQKVQRPGVASLLAWLEKTDFYTAPASTKYHGAKEGGLVAHSFNVFERLRRKTSGAAWDYDTIAIVALLHDLCKIDYYKKGTRNQKDENGKWQQVPCYTIEERFPAGHGEKSVMLIMRHIQLTDEEIVAIDWHMGPFDERFQGGSRGLNNAWAKTPLALLVHIADLEATYLDEREANR